MPQPSTVQSGADSERPPPGYIAVGMPTSNIVRLPVQHPYYHIQPAFTQFSVPFHIPGHPHIRHDTWNCRRYDSTFNYPTMPGTLANETQSSTQAVLYHTTLPSIPQPTYYGALFHQMPKLQHFPPQPMAYDNQQGPIRVHVRNNSNIETSSYSRITHEQPYRTLPSRPTESSTSCYTIVDGSGLTNRSGNALETRGNGAGANAHVQPPVFLPEPPTPRGPPRKPKQSGFALWVGNLPSRANIVDLKDHFSQGATKEIESVFLISNSKCAFVNYRTEAACVSAVARFHDSRFQGIKLVCRMRRGTSELKNRVTLSPPLPAASGTTDDSNEIDDSHAELVPNNSSKDSSFQRPAVKYCERYFIVKSLTIEDLERSRVSGVWATQRHNEAFLNHAYETSETVYLIFSANKSGEYFGYGKMASPIPTGEQSISDGTPQRISSTPSSEFLIVTATPRTETAPAGSVVDDPARGTIFWEIDRIDEVGLGKTGGSGQIEDEGTADDSQSFGRPFNVDWLCWRRLPFHHTRGLRNPWNANKEVKIARDGTEIEPGVGRRLIRLFDLME
ncbi:hypothetical protein I7I50_01610 [Histoplasma capsulatum G186AR]|uniref:YTH domain-containing protein n=1 Tax=Ajellomyces capsulatus TaxID=5037 RepID=A0A8H7YBI9_AJECA|nr:hypothetical protein I7I52_11826 [Histoplasma capsulatum]QSS70943.1 hypothetical protein I7I50_01610 [Histoplasma capsulatum G186AR]